MKNKLDQKIGDKQIHQSMAACSWPDSGCESQCEYWEESHWQRISPKKRLIGRSAVLGSLRAASTRLAGESIARKTDWTETRSFGDAAVGRFLWSSFGRRLSDLLVRFFGYADLPLALLARRLPVELIRWQRNTHTNKHPLHAGTNCGLFT